MKNHRFGSSWMLYSHPVWVSSVFLICPSDKGSYRKRSIKRRGAYFIFHVKGAAIIRERRLLLTTGKTLRGLWRELRVGKKKNKYEHLELLIIWTWLRKFPYIKTLELTSRSWSCLSSDMVLISFYIKRILGDPGAGSWAGLKGATKVFKHGRKSPGCKFKYN